MATREASARYDDGGPVYKKVRFSTPQGQPSSTHRKHPYQRPVIRPKIVRFNRQAGRRADTPYPSIFLGAVTPGREPPPSEPLPSTVFSFRAPVDPAPGLQASLNLQDLRINDPEPLAGPSNVESMVVDEAFDSGSSAGASTPRPVSHGAEDGVTGSSHSEELLDYSE